MTRENIDLYNIGTGPEELQAAILRLRQDFDAHIHDGVSSRSFQTLTAETVSARAILVRKTSYADSAAGIWMGMVGSTMQLSLGNATNYLQWTGSALNIVGAITATSGTIGGFTIAATTLSGGSSLVLSSSGVGTITGGLIRTASSGARVEMGGANNRIDLINASDATVATFYGSPSSGAAIIDLAIPNAASGIRGIEISNGASSNEALVHLTNSGTGVTMDITKSVNNSATVISLVNSSGTGTSISITGSKGHGVYIDATNLDNATVSNAAAVHILMGTGAIGNGILVDDNSDSIGAAVKIDRDSTTGTATITGLSIDVDSAGGGQVIGIDLSGMAAGERIFKLPTDNTDPTGGGGAATGRIAVDIGGVVKYVPYY